MTPDDREKLFGQALIEDFKARWQELLNCESENNQWSTIYVTAIIALAGWFVNSPKSGDIGGLINTGANAYLLLLLAFVNNLYTLSMAMKGYQIQQLGLYLYSEVRPTNAKHRTASAGRTGLQAAVSVSRGGCASVQPPVGAAVERDSPNPSDPASLTGFPPAAFRRSRPQERPAPGAGHNIGRLPAYNHQKGRIFDYVR